MASRPLIAPHSVIEDGDMSGDITSDVTICTTLSTISYSYSWAGTVPVGVISVEVSNDYVENADGSVKNAGNWDPYPGLTGAVSGNTGHGRLEVIAMVGYAIRTIYTSTSGTGLLQATVVGKVT